VPFGARAAGLVALDVGVSERGTVADVTVVKAVEPFSEGLARDIHGWRFRPARRAGADVPARCYLVFVFRAPVTAPGPRVPR
jgi:hypothetical protein